MDLEDTGVSRNDADQISVLTYRLCIPSRKSETPIKLSHHPVLSTLKSMEWHVDRYMWTCYRVEKIQNRGNALAELLTSSLRVLASQSHLHQVTQTFRPSTRIRILLSTFSDLAGCSGMMWLHLASALTLHMMVDYYQNTGQPPLNRTACLPIQDSLSRRPRRLFLLAATFSPARWCATFLSHWICRRASSSSSRFRICVFVVCFGGWSCCVL